VLQPIAEVAKSVPGLRVELREDTAQRLMECLLGGEINAAMVGDIEDVPSRIDEWPLFEERYVAVLAPGHALANRRSIAVDDLREATILERVGCDVAPKIHKTCFAEGLPQLGHGSEHDLHLQHMAAAGLGILLAPEHMPRLPSLKILPIEGDPVWREVRLLAVQGRCYSPALDAFVKVVRLRDWSFGVDAHRPAPPGAARNPGRPQSRVSGQSCPRAGRHVDEGKMPEPANVAQPGPGQPVSGFPPVPLLPS
jgi:DNA-binding transcriptional LysR family regulator